MPRPSTTPKSARIRPALASDLDALVGVVASVLREHGLVSRLESVEHDLRDLDARFGGGHAGLWVAEVDGTLVGCVAIRPKEGLTCELTHLYLSPETRGLGLGQALYQQAEAFARQAGFARVWLESSRGLGAARRSARAGGRCRRR